jgi:glycosyltransferase involved in cell wall biosynthesis
MNIRSFSWGAPNLSWATVTAELMNAFYDLGHNTMMFSTNGMDQGMFKKANILTSSVLEIDRLKRSNTPVDLDFTFTVPQNFPQRFLSNSKHKAAIYAFEYKIWPGHWKQFYNLADIYMPPSSFAAEIFYLNGIPAEKTFVVPHGLDVAKLNASVQPIKLKTQKIFRFGSIVAPHSRKRIDVMLKAYCQAFTAKDDVCLVLKTKAFRKKDEKQAYEVCVGDYLDELKRKYGDQMPEIEVIDQRVDNVASIYNTFNVHVSTTGSECFLIPALECMGCGVKGNTFNIVTNYSGHLDFLNANNSLLIDYKLTPARKEDQYWGFDPRNKIAQADQRHTSELMLKAYREYDVLLERFRPELKRTVEQYSWKNAAQKMLDACEGKVLPYKPGTVRIPK